MTTPTVTQTTAHSTAFSATKALQGRHKGHTGFALPASAGQASAHAAPPPAQSTAPGATQAAAKPARQPPSPGNLLTHPLMAHLAGQSAHTSS